MVTPLQKCYDEISILKEELKKRDEQIEKLIENNINLNKKVESLLYKFPKQKLLTPPRSKVAKFVENYEKNIVNPIQTGLFFASLDRGGGSGGPTPVTLQPLIV